MYFYEGQFSLKGGGGEIIGFRGLCNVEQDYQTSIVSGRLRGKLSFVDIRLAGDSSKNPMPVKSNPSECRSLVS